MTRSFLVRLLRDRPGPAFDRLVRRGGGLCVLTALSVFAGWNLPEFPVTDNRSAYPAERCLVVVGVARFAVPRTVGAAPLLLVQTAWLEGESPLVSSSLDAAVCDASERVLPVPPIANLLFRREGAVFVPSPLRSIRIRSFHPPPAFRLRTEGPSPAPLSPEET